jgi:hypothetical protein
VAVLNLNAMKRLKPHKAILVKLLVLFLLLFGAIVTFAFYPYRNLYYECEYKNHLNKSDKPVSFLILDNRSLVVQKYLFNKFVVILGETENTENIFTKKECMDDSESGLTIECDRKEPKVYHKISFNQINGILEEEMEFDSGESFTQTHKCLAKKYSF